MARTFRQIQSSNIGQDLISSVYLCTGELAPSYEGKELFFRTQSFAPCVAHLTRLSLGVIERNFYALGDYGTVLEHLVTEGEFQLSKSSSSPLSIEQVHR